MRTETGTNKSSTVCSNMAELSGVWKSGKLSQMPSCYPRLVVLAPIQFLYLILAFFKIDHQSLWTDEVISLNFAVSAEPILSIWFNSQCPLYYILLRLWATLVGTTEFAVRTLSVFFGVAAVFLIYEIGSRLFGRKVAAIAALLLATSPFFVWYSQEVRYINLMLATSLLATYSFCRVISTGRLAWWISYSTASIMASFSFVSVVLLFPAHFLYLLWSVNHRSMVRRWVACQLVTFTLFAAWYGAQYGNPIALAQESKESRYTSRRWVPQETNEILELVGPIPYTFFAFSVGFSLGPSVRELHEYRSVANLVNHAPILVPAGILFACLFLFGLARLWEDRGPGMFVSFWLGVPIIGAFAVTIMTSHVYNVRYVAIALPAYILILARGIAGLRHAKIQIPVFAAVLCGIALSNYYFEPLYSREDGRAAAKYLEAAAQPQDTILAVGNPTTLRYYYKGGLPVETIDAGGRNGDLLAGKLQELISQSNRLWLVEIRPWESDPQRRVKAALDNLGRRVEQKEFPGVDIYAYAFAY